MRARIWTVQISKINIGSLFNMAANMTDNNAIDKIHCFIFKMINKSSTILILETNLNHLTVIPMKGTYTILRVFTDKRREVKMEN